MTLLSCDSPAEGNHDEGTAPPIAESETDNHHKWKPGV